MIYDFCNICSEMKPKDEVRGLGKYQICDDCYNTKLETLPKDLEVKIPSEGIAYGCSATYHPMLGQVKIFRDFKEHRCEEVLIHEFFHHTLLTYIGWEACLMWDNVSGCGEIEQEILGMIVGAEQR